MGDSLKNSVIVFFLLLFFASVLFAQESPVMKEFEQILPRGRIAAITEPIYVPAQAAKIGDESWVLGVIIDGEARAYSLTLLNSHEIVNDKIGETAFAAVW
ncbi:MAG: DUF3179 domain-containing protein [Calditrichaeota bacterium]|nr:MAG: DUF3179 domain-containing protein [Calditrichota bacterium]